MEILAYSYAALLGLAIGSFYTATASRVLFYFYGPGRKLPRGQFWREFFTKPSFCMACGTQIKRVDLIPIVGYLSTGGKCRNCKEKFGPTTLIGELLPGFLLPFLLYSGYSWPAAFAAVLICGHLYISIATDYNFFQLDHENAGFLFLFAGLGAFAKSEFEFQPLLEYLYTAGAMLGIFLFLYIISGIRLFRIRGQQGMGFGDVILATALALFSGFPWSVILIQLASISSLVFAFLIKRDRFANLPFGVFLAGGFAATEVIAAGWRIYQNLGLAG